MKLQKTLRVSLLALGILVGTGLAYVGCLMADDTDASKPKLTKEELRSTVFTDKLSQAYGHLIEKSLDNPILKLNFEQVIKGMQDAKDGKPTPMTEQEYEEAINSVQELAYEEMSAKNLKDAEEFLKNNAANENVKEIQPGKLQYMVITTGDGKELSDDCAAEINYKGQYANGQVFGSSEEAGGPITLTLNQTIPGFREGLVGMKEGEKRKLFIHPELGYGTTGQLMPNALLIFEVELVKVKEKPEPTADEGLLGYTSDNLDDSEDSDESLGSEGHPAQEEDEEDYEDHDINVDMNAKKNPY